MNPRTATSSIATFFERFIYGGRWVIAPMYVGLLVALVIYTARFLKELWHMCTHALDMSESELMLSILSQIDAVMIGNLVLMIMVGSYSIFVRKMDMPDHDRPQWLNKISAATLKVKMGMSLVGVSSVHLLRDFIDAEALSRELITKHIAIHVIFIISTLALAFTDRISHPSEPSSPAHP